MIRGFRHAGIPVRDMAAALAFYRDLLGLVLISDRVSGESGSVAGMPGLGARICLLAIPGSPVKIELLHYQGGSDAPVRRRPNEPGSAHASLWAPDLDALHARLVEAGVTVLSPPLPGSSGRRKFYASDPDGFWLELTEAE